MNVAVIGYGYWGPNLVRNFSWQEGTTVKYVCDLEKKRLDLVKNQFPNIEIITQEYRRILADPQVDAVAIATPVHTHFSIAKAALEADKHVLIEKPMTDNARDARAIVALAKERDRIVMVDHTFVYTGAVRKIKEMVAEGQIGDIYYFDSVRVNLGLFQSDINVVWDLAPHDLSIMSYVIDKRPVGVGAQGVAHTDSALENMAYMTVYYEDSTLAHFHVNWLSPIKVRRILIGGSKKMIVYDDMENAEKVKVYDSGVHIRSDDKESIYDTLVQYRTGDMFAPKLEGTEALNTECRHFVECCRKKKRPISDGEFGLAIVRMLEAAQRSIERGGTRIPLDSI